MSSTQAIIKIIDVSSPTITGAKMLFEIGKPHGHDLIAASLTITPKPIRVTPSVGNYYGQIIAIRAPGMTKADESNVSMVRSQRTWGVHKIHCS